MQAVPGGDGAFARVVRKAAALRARVERLDGVGRQRAKAHGRDVEHAGRVGLGAGRAADGDAKVVRVQCGGRERVVEPLVPDGAQVALGAERAFVGLALGARIRQAALAARKRCGLGVALQKILADLGPDLLQHEAEMADDRVVAQHRALGLAQVPEPQHREARGQQENQRTDTKGHQREQAEQRTQNAQGERGVAHRINGVEAFEHGFLGGLHCPAS